MIKKNAPKTTISKNSKKDKKQIIGIIGAGKIGEAIISGLLGEKIKSHDEIIATVASRERAEYMRKKFGITCTNNNIDAIKKADVIILAVKPQIISVVLKEIAPVLTKEKLLISVAAGVSCCYIESFLKKKASVIRAMPNLCCQVYAGMTAISKGSAVTSDQVEIAKKIFEPVSRTIVIDEKHLDAVTGLSGSGPAYIYIAIEALAEGGVKVGLPREVATLLAAQATLGAAKMVLETHEHPALLKEMVTTPAGVTIDGIMELEEGKFRVTLIKAVMKGTERSKELVKH
ncbi:MAG TPA: pyrroline-5-carboxylate reductase [Candidatus Wallbacteria bacterium]|nr:pyrroline-5-carboxylate reductase [Candidatus Wallbacteria bacterium]